MMFDMQYFQLDAVVVAMFGFLLIPFFSRRIGTPLIFSLFMYIWHTFFCGVYIWYVINNGGDSLAYYHNSLVFSLENLRPGTQFVNFIVFLMVKTLDLSMSACFLVFNFLGLLGLLLFFSVMTSVAGNKSTIFLVYIIALLPSISFWTSAIGKDALAFLSTGMALWASLYLQARIKLMFIAIVLMLLIRPHIGLIMFVALACAFFFDSKVSNRKRLVLVVFSLFVITPLVPAVLSYAGVQERSVAGILSYIEERQQFNMDGGGGMDIAQMSLPEKLFAYVYRPTVFESRTLYEFAAALDNLVLLLLTLLAGFSYVFYSSNKTKVLKSGSVVFMMTFAVVCLLVLATTTSNLGISIRQKWMFMPMIIVLLISVLPSRKRALQNNIQSVY
ncbi:MAG: hypothetical protein COB09_08475 [Thalassobium sp.]|nr:MAG: hypothetical protein COB09_08475 [Thalassobium sp.]